MRMYQCLKRLLRYLRLKVWVLMGHIPSYLNLTLMFRDFRYLCEFCEVTKASMHLSEAKKDMLVEYMKFYETGNKRQAVLKDIFHSK